LHTRREERGKCISGYWEKNSENSSSRQLSRSRACHLHSKRLRDFVIGNARHDGRVAIWDGPSRFMRDRKTKRVGSRRRDHGTKVQSPRGQEGNPKNSPIRKGNSVFETGTNCGWNGLGLASAGVKKTVFTSQRGGGGGGGGNGNAAVRKGKPLLQIRLIHWIRIPGNYRMPQRKIEIGRESKTCRIGKRGLIGQGSSSTSQFFSKKKEVIKKLNSKW